MTTINSLNLIPLNSPHVLLRQRIDGPALLWLEYHDGWFLADANTRKPFDVHADIYDACHEWARQAAYAEWLASRSSGAA